LKRIHVGHWTVYRHRVKTSQTKSPQRYILNIKANLDALEISVAQHTDMLANAEQKIEERIQHVEARITAGDSAMQTEFGLVDSKVEEVTKVAKAGHDLATATAATNHAVQNKIVELEAKIAMAPTGGHLAGGGMGPLTMRGKPISEVKVISGLATMGSDRTAFREWSDKFKNALSQAGPGVKAFMNKVEMFPILKRAHHR